MRLSSLLLAPLSLAASALAIQTGERQCITDFGCVTSVLESDTSEITYTMEMPSGFNGWFAIGDGSGMRGSNMQIAWVNGGSVITSQRSAAGEIMPTTSAVRASAFTSITSSVSDAGISVSWVSPLGSISPSSAVDHIWASNANNNPGSDPNGGIQRHPFNERGHFFVNLVTPYSATPASTTTSNDDAGTGAGQQTISPSTGSSRSGSGIRDLSNASVRIQLAHAIVMFLAFLLFFPLGALIARYGRTYTTKWFASHHYIQLFGSILVIIGFALGVRWSSDVKAVHFQSRHEKLGLALFVLVIVQGILGEISHLIMVKKGIRTGYFHILMGVTIFGLSIWEIKMGLDEWSWNPSKGVTYFVYAWAAVIAAAYFAGALLLPREIRQARDLRNEKHGRVGSDEALRSQTRST